MKRPEGFDPPASPEVVEKRGVPRWRRGSASSANAPARAPSAAPEKANTPSHVSVPAASAPRPPLGRLPQVAAPDDRGAERDARKAARERRRDEKREVRRFTRASRRRRVTWAVIAGIAVTMITLVAVAVYSPLLALKTISIDGTTRLDPADLHAAVDGQLETPLALLDFDRMKDELGDFPLIRSYVTETVPPDALKIHILEREPIGTLGTSSGFSLVDPAGIVIERSAERMAGVPFIDVAGGDSDSAAFDAAVEVLIALPDPVLAQLDTVTATTRDDVRLTLAGGGASIVWGSADDSEYKSRVLARTLELNLPDVSEYNVSAPGQVTYR